MPLDYGTGVDEEALRRARNEGLFYGGLSLIGNPNDFGTAIGQAARAGFGAHRESVERSAAQMEQDRAAESADAEELEELERRVEAVKILPPDDQEKVKAFLHAENFWDIMEERGFQPPPEDFTLSPGQQRFDAQGNPIARVDKPQSGFTLGAGQTRYGPDGKPIASQPAAAQEEDEWEPYSFHGGKLWHQPTPEAQPVEITGPEALPDPADRVAAATAAADKVYTMALKEWDAQTDGMDPAKRPDPPRYQDVRDQVEMEMFGGPASAPGPGMRGRANLKDLSPEPPPFEEEAAPPPAAELEGPPPIEATVEQVKARGVSRAMAVSRARKVFGDSYAAQLDEALRNAGVL